MMRNRKKFNKKNPKYISKIYYLNDIKEKYYGESEQNRKELKVQIKTVNKGTVLNMNTKDYKLKNIVEAKYILTPVSSIFEIYKKYFFTDGNYSLRKWNI